MISLLLTWTIVWSASLQASRWLFPSSKDDQVFLNFILGLIPWLLLSQVWCFIVPANYLLIPLVIVAFVGLPSLLKRVRSFLQWESLALLIICLVPSVLRSWINDDISYYLQSIKWYADYGFESGLGNLNIRFALGSSWHSFAATMYWPGLIAERAWNLNGLLALVFGLQLLSEKRYWALALVVFIAYPFLNAPSPDLPLMLLGVVLITRQKDLSILKWMMILSGLLSLKPTAVGYLLLGFIPLINYPWKEWKPILIPVLTVLIVLGRNLMLTGFMLFPLSTDLGLHLPWELDSGSISHFQRQVKAETFDLGHEAADWQNYVQEHPVFNHITALAEMRSYKLAFVGLILLSALGLLLFFRKKGNRWMTYWPMLFIALWIVTVPNYRFALALPLALGILRLPRTEKKYLPILTSLGIGFLMHIAAFQFLTIIDCSRTPLVSMQQFMYPLEYPEPRFKTRQEPFKHHEPEECLWCGDVPLPCVTDSVKRTHSIERFKE